MLFECLLVFFSDKYKQLSIHLFYYNKLNNVPFTETFFIQINSVWYASVFINIILYFNSCVDIIFVYLILLEYL